MCSQELRESLEVRQELGFAHTTGSNRRHRVLNRIQAEELLRFVRVGPELYAFVEVLDPLVVELDGGDKGNQTERCETDADEELAIVPDDHVREPVHRTLRPLRLVGLPDSVWHYADQRGQERQ